MAESKSKEKFDIKHTFLIGLAFFTTIIIEAIIKIHCNPRTPEAKPI
ncbi:unnamed protein product, partial [marine sediment metagenome]